MADYQADDAFEVTEDNGGSSGIEEQLVENYEKIDDCINEVEALAEDIKNMKVTLDDIVCDNPKIMEQLQGYISRFGDIMKDITSIRIYPEMQQYALFGIMMKKAQIAALKVKRMQAVMTRKVAMETKKVLLEAQNGKLNASSTLTLTLTAKFQAMGPTIAIMLIVLDVILSLLGSMTAMSVDGDGMAFFPTPKSMKKSGVPIPNFNFSCNDFLPQAVKDAITQVETDIEAAMGQAKDKAVLSMEANGAAMAAMATLSPFDIGSMSLPKFNADTMLTAVNAIVQALVGAEALPRYEALVPWNIRWMIFLLGGLEPTMKKTFGLPGYP